MNIEQINSLLSDRALTVGQIECENAKSREWDGKRVDSLNRLVAEIDKKLAELGYTGNPDRHLMALS